jgi:hypothetical protein
MMPFILSLVKFPPLKTKKALNLQYNVNSRLLYLLAKNNPHRYGDDSQNLWKSGLGSLLPFGNLLDFKPESLKNLTSQRLKPALQVGYSPYIYEGKIRKHVVPARIIFKSVFLSLQSYKCIKLFVENEFQSVKIL